MRNKRRSVRSAGSAGSLWSIGSSGSILSIGSAGSILSIGSAGFCLVDRLGRFGGIGVLDRFSCEYCLDTVWILALVDTGVAVQGVTARSPGAGRGRGRAQAGS